MRLLDSERPTDFTTTIMSKTFDLKEVAEHKSGTSLIMAWCDSLDTPGSAGRAAGPDGIHPPLGSPALLGSDRTLLG